jgi:hypothetical protein
MFKRSICVDKENTMYPFLLSMNNPISRAELAHQIQSAPRSRRWRRAFVRVLMILAFTLALILAGGEIAGALLYRDPDPISKFFGVANLLPLTAAISLHFILMLQTLSLSANSVAREKQSNNWDMLVLTGVDARQIVRGKWWATVQRQWRSYALLGVLRAAVIIWTGAAVSRAFVLDPFFSYYYVNGYGLPTAPRLFDFLFVALSVFALTMVNLLFTAACGVSAISNRARSSALTLGRAIGTRVLVIIAVGLVGSIVSVFLGLTRFDLFSNVGGGMLATLIDNGVVVSNQLVQWHTTYWVDDNLYIYPAVLLSFGVYLLLTVVLLRIGERQAVQQNALPPLQVQSAKSR